MTTRWDDERLRALARELPVVSPPSDAKLKLLVRARALPPPRQRWGGGAAWAAVGVAAAALVVVALAARGGLEVLEQRARDGESWGVVVQGEAARREWLGDARGRVERLWLRDGTIRLEVPPLELDRRVVVMTDEVALESHGGVFWVEARAGVLTRLEVLAGQVVERRGDLERVVRAGDVWRAPGIEAAPSTMAAPRVEGEPGPSTEAEPSTSARVERAEVRPEGARAVRAEARRAPTSRVVAARALPPPEEGRRPGPPTAAADEAVAPLDTATAAVDAVGTSSAATLRRAATAPARAPIGAAAAAPAPRPDPLARQYALTSADAEASVVARESRFVDGWYAYRRGSFEAAAAAFEDVVTYGGTDALTAEASYLRTRALLRSGSPGRAEVELRRFQARWPGAPRFHELCLELGRQLRPSLARPWLELATGAADGAVREAAHAALADLEP